MATFKNTDFIKRDYSATDVVFCQCETAPEGNWSECEESEIEELGCRQLYKQADVRYFGYL